MENEQNSDNNGDHYDGNDKDFDSKDNTARCDYHVLDQQSNSLNDALELLGTFELFELTWFKTILLPLSLPLLSLNKIYSNPPETKVNIFG